MMQEWIEKDGHIFHKYPRVVKGDFTNEKFEHYDAIAYNVGSEVAKHIVSLHNSFYNQEGDADANQASEA